MKSSRVLWAMGLVIVAMLGWTTQSASAADATGKWSWKMAGRNGGEGREITLTLKQDGEKLTGSVGMGENSTEIKDGKIAADGTLSFSVTQSRGGNETVTKYTGKLDGDTIKGKTQRGDAEARDWEAKRVKEEKKPA